MSKPDYEDLYEYYYLQLLKANKMLAAEPVSNMGYASPWLKIQMQMAKLMLACKKELQSENETIDELQELGL